MKEYDTIAAKEVVIENVIEKSRFVAAALHVDTVEQATAFIEQRRKKYYDATHNCYAYIVDDKAKFSDDGEPQGTAGMPIYDCIKNNGLNRVCVVVTRYFGGVKLGAGGLVRAYNGACADVLNKCGKVRMRSCVRADVVVPYGMLKILRRAMQTFAKEENVVFDDKVTLQYLFLSDLSNTISDIVSQNTLGQGIFEIKEQVLAQYEK